MKEISDSDDYTDYDDEDEQAPVNIIVTVGNLDDYDSELDDDYNIDENKIEAAITKKTKAIMPVIWAGRPCELDKIKKIAASLRQNSKSLVVSLSERDQMIIVAFI